MRRRPAVVVSLAAVLAVAAPLSGCGDGDDDDTTSGSETTTAEPSAATTEPPVDTTEPPVDTTAAPSSTDPPAADPPPTDAPAPTDDAVADGGDCLIGEWVVTAEQMDGFYDGLMGTLEAPLTIDTTGSAPLSFAADGTYAWSPAFALAVEVAGASGTGTVAGTITGNWTAVDGVVTTASDVNALEVSVEVNGISFDGDDMANGLLNSSPVNGVTYSCDGSEPVLDFKTADPGVTVPVTLTPA